MRIIHFSCVAPPKIGGIGQVAEREVVGLRSRGIDARLVAPEPAVKYAQVAERSFVTCVKPWLRIGNGSILPNVKELIKGADLVHLHYPFFGTAEILLSGMIPTPPIVVTFHMDAAVEGWKGWAVRAHRLLIQPWLLRRAAKLIVSSFDYAKATSARRTLAAHPERFVELPFGVDTDFFSPGPPVRARFAVPDGSPIVLFVGGLDRAHAFKGVPELLRAFAMLNPSAHLLIVGDGDLRPRYEAMASLLNILSRVHFLGRVDDETLRDAYRSADVLAFPSTSKAEAFGLVAVEAQACGLPVVASNLPGVRTVIKQNETGILVTPKDVGSLTAGLRQLLTDEPLRRRMAEHAPVWIQERFSWDRHLDGLMEVYRNTCASPS